MTDEERRLRDEVAMHAISGLLTTGKVSRDFAESRESRIDALRELAATAYDLADAMIAARKLRAATT